MFFIRSASKQDLPKIRDLIVESWVRVYGPHEGEERARDVASNVYSVEKLAVDLERGQSEMVVADDGTQIGGAAYAFLETIKEANLKTIHVAQSATGQGIGSEMLQELEHAFPTAQKMKVLVHPKNEQAISFYERHGYTKGEAQSCGVDELDDLPAITFTKMLSGWEM